MLTSLKIQNYRCLKELEVDNLSRINLIAGTNNSGKTSLLEALSLLSGGGRPEWIGSTDINRSTEPLSPESPLYSKKIWEIDLKPFFNEFDEKKTIAISGCWNLNWLSLEITHQQPKGEKRSLYKDSNERLEDLSVDDHRLTFVSTNASGEKRESRLDITNREVRVEPNNTEPLFSAAFIPAGATRGPGTAMLLARLRQQKKAHLLVKALKTIEPKIIDIDDSSIYGQPIVLCDIGYPDKLVPLSVMGEGMIGLTRLILAIASTPNGGVVLVDEIENGFHHSMLPKVWKVIEETARIFDVQVFATTHSYECIGAAAESIRDSLSLHRIDTDDRGNRHVHYSSESIENAIEFNMEMR